MPRPLDREGAVRSWRPYVRCIADLMRLRDWTIDVDGDPTAGIPCRAQVTPARGRRHATVSLTDDFLEDEDEAAQRQTVVHELLHLHLEPARIVAEESMPSGADHFRLMLEYAIDGIADAFAERLPLPGHVRPKKTRKKG